MTLIMIDLGFLSIAGGHGSADPGGRVPPPRKKGPPGARRRAEVEKEENEKLWRSAGPQEYRCHPGACVLRIPKPQDERS